MMRAYIFSAKELETIERVRDGGEKDQHYYWLLHKVRKNANRIRSEAALVEEILETEGEV